MNKFTLFIRSMRENRTLLAFLWALLGGALLTVLSILLSEAYDLLVEKGYLPHITCGDLREGGRLREAREKYGTKWLYLLAIFFAPLVEEYIFRYPLRDVPMRWGHVAVCVLYMTYSLSPLEPPAYVKYSLTAVVVGLGLYAFFQADRDRGLSDTPAWHPFSGFRKPSKWIPVFITSLVFGFAHVADYAVKYGDWSCLMPFAYDHWFYSGILFGAIRVNYGYRFGVLAHFITNLSAPLMGRLIELFFD